MSVLSISSSDSGAMAHGAQQLTITIVPDSGTDLLAGIAGKMSIAIDKDGKHFYDFEPWTVSNCRKNDAEQVETTEV